MCLLAYKHKRVVVRRLPDFGIRTFFVHAVFPRGRRAFLTDGGYVRFSLDVINTDDFRRTRLLRDDNNRTRRGTGPIGKRHSVGRCIDSSRRGRLSLRR